MPLINSPSHNAWISNLKTELSAGKPQAQALAIAYDVQRRAGHANGGSVADRAVSLAHQAARERSSVAAMAAGGPLRPGYATGGGGHSGPNPMLAAQMADTGGGGETRLGGGLVGSGGPGRTDTHNVSVPAGSYVLPADVVSGLGEGNTMAGANVIDAMMSTGPYGIKLPRAASGHTIPRPPAPYEYKAPSLSGLSSLFSASHAASGGAQDGRGWIPIVIAGGEYVVSPDYVAHLGGGDIERGHQILDGFVSHIRKKTVNTLRKLPGPAK